MREASPFVLLSRLVGSALLFLAGILIYSQTHLGIYETADPEFLGWLKVTGVAFMFHSVLLFVAHFMGLADQKEGAGLSIVFNAVYFIQLYRLFANPEMVPVLGFNEGQAYLIEDSEFMDLLVKIVVGTVLLFILINVVGHLKTLVYRSKSKGGRSQGPAARPGVSCPRNLLVFPVRMRREGVLGRGVAFEFGLQPCRTAARRGGGYPRG